MRKINPKSLANLQPGISPGRPRGAVSGRAKVLQTLDAILAEQGTQDKIAAFYEGKINEDLHVFLKDHVYPFIPKEAKLTLESDITVLIRQKAQQLVESIQDDIEKIDVS